MPNAFRILKPIQKSSKCVWAFRNTGANAFAKNQTRLAYEDKRDLYCMASCRKDKDKMFFVIFPGGFISQVSGLLWVFL